MDMILTFIALALVGVVVGIFSGMLGIGGGTVMVPVFRLGLGLSAYAATATSLFTMVFTSISGVVSHVRQKTSIPALGVCLGLGGCITSALGVYLGSISPSWAIMLVMALVIFYSAQNMLRKAHKLPKGKRKAAKPAAREGDAPAPAAPAAPTPPTPASAPAETSPAEEDFRMSGKRALGGFGIGLIAGLAAGYVGVGGGFIMVPLMTAWLGVPIRKASGTSLVAIIILAIPGIIEQIMLGQVDFIVGIAMAVGSIPGAVIGAKIVKVINERQFRLIFAAFLIVIGVILVANEFMGAA